MHNDTYERNLSDFGGCEGRQGGVYFGRFRYRRRRERVDMLAMPFIFIFFPFISYTAHST